MSDRIDAIREKLAAVPEGWVGGWFMASDVAYLLAELDKARAANEVVLDMAQRKCDVYDILDYLTEHKDAP